AAAMNKDDVKAIMLHVTGDSQSYAAGLTLTAAVADTIFFGFMNDRVTPKQKEEHCAAIDKVLNRHGVSEDAALRKLEKNKKEWTLDEGTFMSIGELVKDKPAFITEISKVCSKSRILADWFKEIGGAKTTEVKIDSQQAKGQATFLRADGKEDTAT